MYKDDYISAFGKLALSEEWMADTLAKMRAAEAEQEAPGAAGPAGRPALRVSGKKHPRLRRAALPVAAAVALPGAVDTDDGAGGASNTLARPDGDPSGQSAEDNIYITTGVMDQETYRSETVGQTKAKVGFIDYNQNVHNVRVVTSDSVFTEAISTSMFVKLGEQKYFKDGAILVRKAPTARRGATRSWPSRSRTIRMPTGRIRATSATTSSVRTRCKTRP